MPAHVQPLLLTLTFQDLSHPSSSTHLYQQHSPETLNWGQFCLSEDIHLEGSHLGRKDATDIQLVETRATSKQPTVPRAALNSKDDAAQNITSTEAVPSSQHHLLPELFHIPPPLSPYPPGSLQPTLHSLLPEESFKKTNVVPCLCHPSPPHLLHFIPPALGEFSHSVPLLIVFPWPRTWSDIPPMMLPACPVKVLISFKSQSWTLFAQSLSWFPHSLPSAVSPDNPAVTGCDRSLFLKPFTQLSSSRP